MKFKIKLERTNINLIDFNFCDFAYRFSKTKISVTEVCYIISLVFELFKIFLWKSQILKSIFSLSTNQ